MAYKARRPAIEGSERQRGAPSSRALRLSAKSTVVGIGELAVLSKNGTLVTYALGSCVGVVGYDRNRKIAGLLHVLLPQSKSELSQPARNPAAYADTGVPALALAMRRMGGDPMASRFHLAGGASMLKTSATLDVGRRNVMAVRKALWNAGLFVQAEMVGGNEPRTLTIDAATGIVRVQSPGRPELAL